MIMNFSMFPVQKVIYHIQCITLVNKGKNIHNKNYVSEANISLNQATKITELHKATNQNLKRRKKLSQHCSHFYK